MILNNRAKKYAAEEAKYFHYHFKQVNTCKLNYHVNSIQNIIPLLKKEKKYIYIIALEVIIITRMRISNPLGKTWPWR